MLVIEQTDRPDILWQNINWTATEQTVRRIQERIFRATQQKEWRQVKNLQKLLIRSTSAHLLAIRKVTQENPGKRTPGIDGKVADTPEARQELLESGLSFKAYRPLPVKRVLIPKPGGKTRPLGIPTVKDRVMQTLVKLALEPEWESQFEANSYGFRPGRNTMDAITQLHITLNGKGCSEWILDADIRSCFDQIDHQAILDRVPVFKTVIFRWLKAGVIEWGQKVESEQGTPQGGPLSPLLANIALHGMEALFGAEHPSGINISPARRSGLNKGISVTRFADDFIVTAPSKERIEDYVMPKLQAFLKERGLEFSEAKTRITHVDEGFNFLGFTIRRFKRAVLTYPQKEKVKQYVSNIRSHLKNNKQARTEKIIRKLNLMIRGWINYYRFSAAKSTFNKLDYLMWLMLWRWAKRRHPKKSGRWVRKRYFTQHWTFHEGDMMLQRHTKVPVTRYVKVQGKASPLNPGLRSYWKNRRYKGEMADLRRSSHRILFSRQQGKCALCQAALEASVMHNHHVLAKVVGGSDGLENRVLVHPWCHQAWHQRVGYLRKKA
ncbi:group II intron reverse transcriptase/maturase [Deinococcus roseus]|uniref:Group II intron reverse transcriptase/maturase n=1 Tax=Deinococcus roseus TaxID=392414 RepID=A0ABQ2DG83_9DEIO|nr:group II intron reverse transcriptase/maturase [Deinococcus roseus]GGJ56870.1 group II intron reverse transcriptase/maturase [Deinococcus roseus]